MNTVRYLSVCSGIEAATCAWHDLGWTPVAFSEIEAFPSAVLAHHYPDTPNWGDMTRFKEWPDDSNVDVLVGGTPCQSFSVAGLRRGLADPRGNLALAYLAVAERYRPDWLVWENVPGVLSSDEGRDFGAFLGALGKLGYGFAYRVLDAQFFGVAQRRRRVFVVASARGWAAAAAVLFEPESLRRNPPPSRESGQAAPTIPSRSSAGGGGGPGAGTDEAAAGYLQPVDVAHTLKADGFDASEDGTGRGTPLVPIHCIKGAAIGREPENGPQYGEWLDDGTSYTLNSTEQHAIAFSGKDYGADADEHTAPTLRAMGHDGSHANAGGQVAVAFDMRGREGGAMPEGPHDTANIRAASGGSSRSYVAQSTAVRRLTPCECERLQGFPDDYTLIPYRNGWAKDGPRYKALGNSMAVPVMRWIGWRIAVVDAIV